MWSSKRFAMAAAAVVAVAGALGWVFSVWFPAEAPVVRVTGDPVTTSEFELVDQSGRAVRDEDLRGKWQLVFFGFTSCPDICPTTLTNVSTALKELGPATTGKLQPLLITVDPVRDEPVVLKEYLSSFDPRILGLTGTPEQVQQALRSFRVYASQRPLEEEGGYTVDHSTFIYLMDPQGDYAAHFSAQTPIEELVREVRARVDGGTTS
jgi:protein SCO1